MDIKLDQYKVFKICAETGSFSEAAKKLFITQSAVSQQIRSLESAIGTPLFVRIHKGVSLTPQGSILLGFVNESLSIIESAESLFGRMNSLEEGELRIGAGDTITKYFVLPLLEKFHKKYSGINIEIVNRVTDETLSKLVSGKIDIAFVNLPIDKPKYTGVDIKPVVPLHDVFVAGKEFSHLAGKKLTESDIASLPLVMLEPKSNTRKYIDNYFSEKGIKLSPEFELGSHDLVIDFAKSNLGIACVTKEFSKDYIDGENLFELDTAFDIPKRSIGVCTLSNISLPQTVKKLTDMIFEN